MVVGIIGAMDEEIVLLLKSMTKIEKKSIANTLFYEGQLKGKHVVLLKSGIGKVNAAMAATILHEQFSPSYVINTGSAGGFSNKLSIGDIVISSDVVHHDVDVTAFGYSYGQVPGMPEVFTADAYLIGKVTDVLMELDINSVVGQIGTGDSFMEDSERIALIRGKFPTIIAAEMEAAAIAQVSFQYKTPFVIIRALSDIAGEESTVSFDSFLSKAADNAATLIMKVVKTL